MECRREMDHLQHPGQRLSGQQLGPPARCQLLPTFLVGRVPLLKSTNMKNMGYPDSKLSNLEDLDHFRISRPKHWCLEERCQRGFLEDGQVPLEGTARSQLFGFFDHAQNTNLVQKAPVAGCSTEVVVFVFFFFFSGQWKSGLRKCKTVWC